MPAPQARLGAKWLSPTDIRSTITHIAADRTAHSNLLRNLSDRIQQHGEGVSRSLRGLDAKDRPSVVARSVAGFRNELVRESADQRRAHTRKLGDLAERIKSAAGHYRSPVQMLMRETLGSERRSRMMEQIAASGPVELAALAEFAAATNDKDLAAALCGRVADLPRADRPFKAQDLADVMFGELHRELSQALVEAERRVLEGLHQDGEFETGKANPQRSLQIALLKKRERQIGAYGFDDDDELGDVADEDAGHADKIAGGLRARREGKAAAD